MSCSRSPRAAAGRAGTPGGPGRRPAPRPASGAGRRCRRWIGSRCGSERSRSQPGQQRGDQPGLVERLPDGDHRLAGAEQRHQRVQRAASGHGSGSRRASWPAARTVAGDTGRPACAAAAAARSARVGSAAGLTDRASTASPSCSTMPSASGVRSGRRISRPPTCGQRAAGRSGQRAADPVPGQVDGVRRPSGRSQEPAAATRPGRPARARSPTGSWSWTCSRSVARPVTGAARRARRAVRERASSRPWCGQSATQDAAHRPHHHQVAQAAAGLLEVGLGGEGELAAAVGPFPAGRQQRRQPVLGVGPPVGEHPPVQGGWPAPGRRRCAAGRACRARPAGRPGRPAGRRRRTAPSGRAGSRSPRSGTTAARPASRHRTPGSRWSAAAPDRGRRTATARPGRIPRPPPARHRRRSARRPRQPRRRASRR